MLLWNVIQCLQQTSYTANATAWSMKAVPLVWIWDLYLMTWLLIRYGLMFANNILSTSKDLRRYLPCMCWFYSFVPISEFRLQIDIQTSYKYSFSQEPREVCTKLPDLTKYKPRLFTTTALQQAKVELTWDTTNPNRAETIKGALDGKIDDLELKDYLASSSESEGKHYITLQSLCSITTEQYLVCDLIGSFSCPCIKSANRNTRINILS